MTTQKNTVLTVHFCLHGKLTRSGLRQIHCRVYYKGASRLIRISDEPQRRAEALFTAGEERLRLRLKPEYEQQIQQDIATGVARYGSTPAYWQYVRELALLYWSEWDRRAIFDAEQQ